MPHSVPFNWDSFRSFPAVGILRGFPTELVKEIGQQCFEAGLTNLEVTLNTEDALQQIRSLRDIAPANVNIGAGTVIDETGLNAAIDAGANFIVSPVTDEDLIQKCTKLGVPIMPGAYTPSEVLRAWKSGAKIIKLFPANIGGPDYAKSILAPLDQIELLAVGNVNLENLEAYLRAGISGIGLGTPLFDKKRMENRDWKWLRDQIAAFHSIFKNFE